MRSQKNDATEKADRELKKTPFGRFSRIAVALFVLCLFSGLAVGGITVLHMRAQAEPQQKITPPISVSTAKTKLVDSYLRTGGYTGRVEPARETNVAFERAGLVTSIEVDEGQRVRSGDLIARLDTAQLAVNRQRLLARRKELNAQLELAKLTLGRQSKLQRRGWTPKQRFDEARTTLNQLNAALDQLKAQIAATDIDIDKSELRAPFDGYVATRFIDEGTVAAAGTPVLHLQEAKNRQARIGLPPQVAAQLRKGETYSISGGTTTLDAKLISKRRDLQTRTRTVTTLFEISGDGEQIAFGDLVTLEIQTRVNERGAWMPLAALKEGRRGMWTVLTVDRSGPDPIIRPETVEVLYVRGEKVFVRGTFLDGVETLIDGTDRVVAGQRVALVRE